MENWRAINPPTEILKIVEEGYMIQPIRKICPMKLREEDPRLTPILADFHQRDIIQENSELALLNPMFTIAQAEKIRPILDLRAVNGSLPNKTFRMEGLKDAKRLMQRNFWFCKVDLKDAYLSIGMHPQSQRFLGFNHQGKTYAFKRLPFGLNTAPRIFTRVLKAACTPLREKGFIMVAYLDDILLMNACKETVEKQVLELKRHLEKLGFLVNMKKSTFIATQRVEFLGNLIDSKELTISIPPQKIWKTTQEIHKVLKLQQIPIRKLAALSGQMGALAEGMQGCWVSQRMLQRNIAIYVSRGISWDSPIPIFKSAKEDLRKFAEQIQNAHKRIKEQKEVIEITTDASEQGYGFHMGNQSVHGQWTFAQAKNSSNWRELCTVYQALSYFRDQIKQKSVIVFTDNSTTVSQINNQSNPRHAKLLKLSRKIWKLVEELQIDIKVNHLAGQENWRADFLSRMRHDTKEWTLSTKARAKIQRKFGTISVDLFASPFNRQAERFVTLHPWPEAIAVDAFSLRHWEENALLNPPLGLIPKVLEKAQQMRSKNLIFVTPMWPSRPWWPILLQNVTEKPLVMAKENSISKNSKILDLPFQELVVWKLSFD